MIEGTVIRDYLLGRRDEASAEAIETQTLEDDESFLAMRSIEDDLFDEFARGTMTAADREAFLQRYGGQTQRIAFASALAKRRSSVAVFRSPRRAGYAAAAVIAIALVAIVMRQPPRPPHIAVYRQVGRSTTVTLAIGSSRSASQPAAVVVRRNVSSVRLRLRLNPADRYDSYTVTLRSSRASWTSGPLRASSEAGDLIVDAQVPAKNLEDGSYEVAVSGGGEELGYSTMEVHRQK